MTNTFLFIPSGIGLAYLLYVVTLVQVGSTSGVNEKMLRRAWWAVSISLVYTGVLPTFSKFEAVGDAYRTLSGTILSAPGVVGGLSSLYSSKSSIIGIVDVLGRPPLEVIDEQ